MGKRKEVMKKKPTAPVTKKKVPQTNERSLKGRVVTHAGGNQSPQRKPPTLAGIPVLKLSIPNELTAKFDEDSSDDSDSAVAVKKRKKHKKKHKRKRLDIDEGHKIPSEASDVGGSPKGSIKLKFKIGRETLATKNVVTVKPEATDTIVNVTDEPWVLDDYDPTIVTKKPGDETSDEEKEWLNALEKGELNDYGELSKEKDPNLMTARQRAMKHGKQEQQLMELPSGYRQTTLTEEQLKKKQQRDNKRKQMAHEKREKDKRQTLDRLLKKQESRLKGGKSRGSRKTDVPKYHYSNNQSGISISVPAGHQFPFTAQKAEPPKPPSKCGVSGCSNDKKYSCSKTGVPLCSLQCYKANLLNHQLTLQSVTT